MFVNLLDIGGAVVPCFFGVSLSSSGNIICSYMHLIELHDIYMSCTKVLNHSTKPDIFFS